MSKELRSIVEHFDSLAKAGDTAVLATVIDVRGSSYRLPGARMLIDPEGNTHGTVSGGCLEADLMVRAKRVRETAIAEVFIYDTSINDDSVFGLNMGCRGVVRILLEPAEPPLFEFLHRRLNSRLCGVIATVVSVELEAGKNLQVGARLMMDERGSSGPLNAKDLDGELQAVLAEDCFAALENKHSGLKAYEFGEVFIEYIPPPVPLVVFGAGHDAVPLIRLAKEMGWRVTLVDHRPVAAQREAFLIADEIIIGRPQEVANRLTIDSETVAVLMTHNYSLDLELSEFLLRSPARYIGMLGPRSRADRLLHDLSRIGIDLNKQEVERVYAPVGIDIGAETPEEIALSIIAEIRAVLGGRQGRMLRERTGPIHGLGDTDEAVSVSEAVERSLIGS
ncbi:MAG TPA: XdhC/CoxI family protein [Blastocatellia bacterium]|nr:XdhC/CoxI family protein [Blastocatellia bacterium]